MRNAIILVFFLMITTVAAAQEFGIGKSYTGLETALKTSITESGMNPEGQLFLVSENKEIRVVYVFDADGICKISYLFPKNELVYGELVHRWNAEFSAVGSRTWEVTNGNTALRVDEKRSGDGTLYFEIK